MSRGQAASDGMPTHHCRGTRPSSRPTLMRFSCEIGEEIAARCSDAQVYAGSRSKSAERKQQETLRWTVPRREANSQSGVSSDKTSLSSNDSVDLKTRAPLPCPTVVLSPQRTLATPEPNETRHRSSLLPNLTPSFLTGSLFYIPERLTAPLCLHTETTPVSPRLHHHFHPHRTLFLLPLDPFPRRTRHVGSLHCCRCLESSHKLTSCIAALPAVWNVCHGYAPDH